jgi:outer membrane protein assembly factor BamB
MHHNHRMHPPGQQEATGGTSAMRPANCGLSILLALFALGLMDRPASAADWSRFRGPNGTGIASEQDIPLQWDEQAVLWKTTIPGAGNSSPVVWGDRVFLQTAATDGNERSLVCLHAADGKVLWSAPVAGSFSRTHPKNSQTSSTPATDGQRVYAMFWDGRDIAMFAYDFQGKLLWKTGLGRFRSQHGPGTSPIVHDGKVFFANDCDGSSMLFALDAATGKVAWQTPRQAFRACYSTPFVLELPGGAPQLIVASTAGVSSYNPQTGAESWRWEWKFDSAPLRTVGSPVFSQGLIFVCSGDGSGARHAVAIKPRDRVDGGQENLVWENKKTLSYVPSPVGWENYIYYVHDRGVAICCDAKTGKSIWSERLGGDMSASPILIDGKIYAASEDGYVYVFAAAPTFKLLAKNPIGETIIATPAVADGHLLVRGSNHVFCIGKGQQKRASITPRSK